MPTRRRGNPGVLGRVYHRGMCDKVMAVGRKGGGTVQMALACGVFIKTLYAWRKRHPEFRVAYERARQMAQEYWEDLGKAHLLDASFNHEVWSRFMMRFEDYCVAPRIKKHVRKDNTAPATGATRTVVRDQEPASPE